MTEIFYFDSSIDSISIREYSSSSKYSEIRIGNKILRDQIQDLLPRYELKIIDDLSIIAQDPSINEIFIFSSSVFSKDLTELSKFLEFTGYSMINAFWGHKNCFIYKGNKARFIAFLTEQVKRDIFFLAFPDFILDLTSLPVLTSLLSNSHDSRHFNTIKSVGDFYVKKSSDTIKLKSEFEFLNNVPDHLNNYFVKVFEYQQEPGFSQYTMESYDYKDVSHLFLSNSLNEETFQILMSIIQKYFFDAGKPTGKPFKKNSFENLISKNTARLEQLKKIDYYNSLNSFLMNHKGISIGDHHSRLQRELEKREKIYKNENYIFSHGDLCFSNILFSPQNMDIKLIDPKGFENNG